MDSIAWQGLNYFLAANGALGALVGVVVVGGGASLSIVGALIAGVGAVVSVVWALVQMRQMEYHHLRGQQARKAEAELKVDGQRILTLYEESLPGIFRAHTLIVFLGWFMVAVWIATAAGLLYSSCSGAARGP